MKIAPIRNFLFHRVNPQRDPLWDPMDVDLFDRCIRFISRRYKVSLFEDLVARSELYDSQPQATIMFDDGYKDNIEYAAPILEKYNCRASFYVVTDCIDRNLPTWTYRLDYAFRNTAVEEIDMGFDFLPGHMRVTKLSSKNNRESYVRNLKPMLKLLAHSSRKEVLDRVSATFHDVETPGIMMNWADLNELKSAGHYIGSHTVNHPMLGTMDDEQSIRMELLESGKVIEERLGYFPDTISYPVGSFNETTRRLSSEVGYKIGLAVKQDVFRPDKEDLFEVSRIELHNEPWWKTRLRITNTLEEVKKLIRYR